MGGQSRDAIALDRRMLFRLGAVGIAGLGAASTLTSCAAPAVVFGASWLENLAVGIAASAIVTALDEPLTDAWVAWESGWRATMAAQGEEGYSSVSKFTYGDLIPPALFFAAIAGEEFDVSTDRLLVCVDQGTASVTFEPWAWKSLSLFVEDLTSKSDDPELVAGLRALCKLSLIPSAVLSTNSVSESGRSTLLTYKTRNGEVEMNRRTTKDGKNAVQVTATGISVDDSPMQREFEV